MKTTCRRSWLENLFQVLNLTFETCCKVKGGHNTKMSLSVISRLLVLWLQNVKQLMSSSGLQVLMPVKNFGIILKKKNKNKMATIADCFKIIKILKILKQCSYHHLICANDTQLGKLA